MSDEFDDIFDHKVETKSETAIVETTEPETVEETVEAPVEETKETTPEVETETAEEATTDKTKEEEQPRDEKGQFASKRNNLVPVEALIAERRKAQAEAQQRAELEQRYRELEAEKRQSSKPDSFENEQAYESWLLEEAERRAESKFLELEHQRQQQLAFEQHQAMFQNFSATVGKHAPEQVSEALEYAAAYAAKDDKWGREVLQSDDPVARILEDKNRHAQQEAEWAEYARNPQEFIARKAAEMSAAGAVQAAQTAAATASATPSQMAATAKTPRSLASAAAGTPEARTDQTSDEAFDAIFNPKR